MASSALFGLLWYTVGRGPAILIGRGPPRVRRPGRVVRRARARRPGPRARRRRRTAGEARAGRGSRSSSPSRSSPSSAWAATPSRPGDANRAAVESAPPVASTALDAVLAGPHLVFRSTLPGNEYGLVAAVPLDDPDGPRAFTDVACDRVDVAGPLASCLRTIAGIATRWEAEVLDADWQPVETWGLPGIPSRTRLSDDGSPRRDDVVRHRPLLRDRRRSRRSPRSTAPTAPSAGQRRGLRPDRRRRAVHRRATATSGA